MTAVRALCRSLFLHLLLLLLTVGFSAGADEGPAEGPNLQISSISGNLEMGRPSSIYVVLQNNASPSKEPADNGFNKATAGSIEAELYCSDDRIKIFSGPQMAGSLAAGENATVQFMALAEGVALGIYPLQLRLNYSRLSQVTVSGDERIPNFVFAYESVLMELPSQVEVVRGPKIELEKLVGETLPGIEASLQLILTNRGDEPAFDLLMQARPNPPFLMVENGKEQPSLAPDESAPLSLSVFTDEDATSGYYVLPCMISYRDEQDGERRSQELSVLVFVGESPFTSWLHLGLAGLMVLLLAGGLLGLKRFMSGGKKLRIIKS